MIARAYFTVGIVSFAAGTPFPRFSRVSTSVSQYHLRIEHPNSNTSVGKGKVKVMRRLIVFDLDGVLVDTKAIHFKALNLALSEISPDIQISFSEHLLKFDGKDTRSKLAELVFDGRLSDAYVDKVWRRKQEITAELLAVQPANAELQSVLSALKLEGFTVAIASNSIRATVESEVKRLRLASVVDFVLSNEDVSFPKPHPEIYWKAMLLAGVGPEETLILEDSSVGRRAALRSGAKLLPVDSPSDISMELVQTILLVTSTHTALKPWKAKNLNILIPMAGAGSRFANAGYTFPKPLIEVAGKTMIEVVVKNLNIDANYIFLVQAEHFEKYNLSHYLNLLAPDCKIVVVDTLTDGAARTALLAKEFIDNSSALLIANSDQFVNWDSSEALYQFGSEKVDGALVTFKSTHPKWSFAEVDDNGWVRRVAEKDPISDVATTGIYFWSRGSDFVKCAEQMIEKDIRTNGEFYICPVYNEAIGSGLRIKTYEADRMWGLGTPEDLNSFLSDPLAAALLREQ